MPELIIRHAQLPDLHDIVRIYNHYVDHTAITFDLEPHTVDSRHAWFDAFADSGRHQLLVGVAEQDGAEYVIGYACTSQLRYKRAYDTSVETSVYLDATCTGKGYGAKLYAALFDRLVGEDVHQAFAGITLPNVASVRLHERFGFKSMGVWEQVGRKFDQFWDVQWMARRMNTTG